ncbi:hypothetical protein J6590_062871 [Homalodisca vitripennis]|nr:hypothetical protein J6590_062871 [Homalodisca vitripennis]
MASPTLFIALPLGQRLQCPVCLETGIQSIGKREGMKRYLKQDHGGGWELSFVCCDVEYSCRQHRYALKQAQSEFVQTVEHSTPTSKVNTAIAVGNGKDKNGTAGFPQVIQPLGLSEARKNYLYKNIRPYLKNEFKDLMCPAPNRFPEELEKNLGDTENPEPTRTLDVAGPSCPAKRKRTL